MTTKPRTVFLSGTRSDLKPYFLAARTAIEQLPGYRVVSMDNGDPDSLPPNRWSRREASKPDLLIGLIGHYYGTISPGAGESITEQEYDVARRAGVDVRIFLTDTGRESDLVANKSEQSKSRIKALRARVDSEVTRCKVDTAEEFADAAVRAIQSWERRTLLGATSDVEEYFRPWTVDPLLGHETPLVARDEVLNRLDAFAASDRRVLLLHAPWGTGKSRVLLEWGRTKADSVRFLKETAMISREALDLSAVDPCVLVLEDAHKRSSGENVALLDIVSRFSDEVRLIVSTRSSRAEEFERLLHEHGIGPVRYESLELTPLTNDEQRTLIARILGKDDRLAYVLAERTKGSALAAVLAARLVQRRAVSIREIEKDSGFEKILIPAFNDAVMKEIPRGTSEDQVAALRVVALAGPIRTGDLERVEALAAFVGWKPEKLHEELSLLENAGLLIRRGGVVRIPVDAIAESVLLEACINEQGESRGYAERALRELWALFRKNILWNLALMDADASRLGSHVDFLGGVWDGMLHEYQSLPGSGRLQFLEDIQDVAQLQPEEAVRFVRSAIPLGLGPAETGIMECVSVEWKWLVERLVRLLDAAVQDPGFVSGACDLLWQVARDVRTDITDPEAPEATLRRIGEYRAMKPLAAYESFVSWTEQKWRHREIPGHRLAVYLTPLLEKEPQESWADRRTIHLSSRSLSYEKLRPLRTRVLALLQDIAVGEERRDTAAGVHALSEGLRGPMGAWREVPAAGEDSWETEERDVLGRFQEIVQIREEDPATLLCILQGIHWVAESDSGKACQGEAAELVARIRTALRDTIELSLTNTWQISRGMDEEEQSEHEQEIRETGERIARSSDDPAAVLRRIAEAYSGLAEMGRQPNAHVLFETIARKNAALGEAFVEEILEAREHPLAITVGSLLTGLLSSAPDVATTLVDRATMSGNVRVRLAAVNGYARLGWGEHVPHETLAARLERLLSDADCAVRGASVEAIGTARSIPNKLRAKLLLAYDVKVAPETGETWAASVLETGIVGALSKEDQERLAAALLHFPELGYWARKLVGELCRLVPGRIVDVMIERIAREEESGEERYHAIPRDASPDMFQALPQGECRRALTALSGFLRRGFRASHAAKELFAHLSKGDPDLVRGTRMAWATSGDPDAILAAVESLGEEEPRVLFDEEGVVSAALRGAESCGTDCLKRATSSLASIAFSGMRAGTPGEPMPLDVEVRDKARGCSEKYPADSVERRFYGRLAESMERHIESEMRREEEETA